jgi:hypothetical protein
MESTENAVVTSLNVPSERCTLMEFVKTENGVTQEGRFDIIDGKFDYRGDLPITDAAQMLFDYLARNIDAWWLERAAKKDAA